MKLRTKIIVSSLFYLMVAVGASFVVKANIGMDAFYAFTNSVSVVTSIRVGTIVSITNILFVFIFMFLSKGKYIYTYIIQIISIIIFGLIVNLLVYNVFSLFEVSNYVTRFVFLILGISISAVSIGIITVLQVITFPVEASCYQLEKNKTISFVKARYGLDVILFASSIALSFIFNEAYFIREGTIVAMIVFTLLLNMSKSFTIKMLDGTRTSKLNKKALVG